jgi:hypothetical protein
MFRRDEEEEDMYRYRPGTMETDGSIEGIGAEPSELFQKWRLDSSVTLMELEQNLRGNFQNPSTKQWEQRGKPLANEEGIKLIITIVSPYISKEVALSFLSNEQINNMMRSFDRKFWIELNVHENEWGVIIPPLVHNTVTDFVWCCLLRALEGATAKGLTDTIRTHQVERIVPDRRGGRSILPRITPKNLQ